MRKIVDSNYLQRDELKNYLSSSKGNYVVLNEYLAMEAYKGSTLSSIFKSMSVLSRYPKQVIVLKATQSICGLESKKDDFVSEFIDQDQTNGFSVFCLDLEKAQNGNFNLIQQITKYQQAANVQMNRILDDVEKFRKGIGLIAETYCQDELKALRKGSAFPEGMGSKIIQRVLELAAILFNSHPQVETIPDFKNLRNSYLFRYSLCSYLLALDWVASGGASGANLETLRNDVVDISFVTYATFFDGIFSADGKVNQLYEETCEFFTIIFPQQDSV